MVDDDRGYRGGSSQPVAAVTAAEKVEVRTLWFADDGVIPNNPDLAVAMLPGAVESEAGPQAIGALLEANGWHGSWTYTVFDFHHYHPDGHEVLVGASGWADLMLGGASGEVVRVAPGDVVVLPAGTGHCRHEAGPGFRVCGAYPAGQEGVEIRRGTAAERGNAPAEIAMVGRPETDPIYGETGPLLDVWRR